MRSILILAVASLPVCAQPSALATTDNGSVILFSSPQIQRGSDQVLNAKIFRIDSNGIALVEERVAEGIPGRTNYYQLTSSDISGDGTVQVINAERPCIGGSFCVFVERHQATIATFGQTLTANGLARLSRNGRYYALYGSTGPILGFRTTLGDRVTGTQTQIPGNAFYAGTQSGRAITNDGGVLVIRDGALILWRVSGEARVPTTENPIATVCDDAGSTVIYETALHQSRVVRLSGGREIALNGGLEARDAQISGDGSIIVFSANGQLYTEFADGTGLRRITSDPLGIVQATLAGSGWVAYAATGNGRIVGIDVRTGSNFEFLAPMPSIQLTRGGFAPGSAIRIFGQGYSPNFNVAPSPLPKQLAGAQVLLDGSPMPIQVVTPTEVRFQLPWELVPPPAGSERISRLLLETSNPLFDAGLDVSIKALDPRAEPVTPPFAPEEMIAIHENNMSPVSSSSPAKTGEVVHIYLTGLGPVSPAIGTGLVTPLIPLSLVTNPVRIQMGTIEAEVLQARLQPALLGYYMADVRVPTGISGPVIVNLSVGSGPTEAFASLGVLYVQ